jgi:hypothetical protein
MYLQVLPSHVEGWAQFFRAQQFIMRRMRLVGTIIGLLPKTCISVKTSRSGKISHFVIPAGHLSRNPFSVRF